MSNSTTESTPVSPDSSPQWAGVIIWLVSCLLLGVIAAPIFYGMPNRMKLIGLHAWALAGLVGAGTSWLARQQGIRSPNAILVVSVIIAIGSNLLQAHWGYTELKTVTAQRMPAIPLPVSAESPEEIAESLRIQQELSAALVPTFRDFQRRRMSAPMFRRIRAVPLWGAEMVIAAFVALLASYSALRQMTPASVSDSLPPHTARNCPPTAD